MIPKVLTAIISAAILSAVLGAMPCEATSVKRQSKAKAATARLVGTPDLNSPATDFSSVKPVIDDPDPNLSLPKKDKNQFFDQTIR